LGEAGAAGGVEEGGDGDVGAGRGGGDRVERGVGVAGEAFGVGFAVAVRRWRDEVDDALGDGEEGRLQRFEDRAQRVALLLRRHDARRGAVVREVDAAD